MCGLNLAMEGSEIAADSMNARIAHRGLSSKTLALPRFSLGHVRLPIVGLSERFDQPFRKHGWTFLFVGEIVNYKELEPNAESDVEVLADLWSQKGPSCVKLFDGFWSFVAIEDRTPWIAHVVTDFLAKKPLYIRNDLFDRDGPLYAVSSEIKGLRALGFLEPDPVYFSSVRKFGYHAGSRTWARGVWKIPPGAHLKIDASTREITAEVIDEVLPDPTIDIGYAIQTAVRRRVLSSDVPVALLLSGGLDSSIIYRLACGLSKDEEVRRGFSGLSLYHVPNGEDEFVQALEPKEPLNVILFDDYPLDDVLRANEGPVDLGSMLQQYALGQAVGEAVCLSGDGADELFGGYRRAEQYDSQGSDVFEELVFYHLPRLDKMMMAGTVELRSPFLARDVVAGALSLPYEERTHKQWLRKAFADILPRSIVEAPKRALKSPQVLDDPIAWRYELCDRFLKIIEKGQV